ncbi:MAG: hypothetical protein M0D55_10595 [Elusimicrobiota bacterium]|nr:MAG: hypothetical protein M0D55_10595 [Elusimicrobiota bacterium]
MGKLLAAAIIVYSILKLAPMCARLPDDLTKVSTGAPAAAVPAQEAPVASTAAATPEPVKPAWPADKPAVTVNTYRMKTMFKIADGKGMVSVSVKNVSAVDAKDLKLALSAIRGGARAERWTANTFDLAASTSVYRGLRLNTGTIDAMLAEPAEPGSELRWDLSYTLDGETDKRCYVLRALPRTREPEGIEWKTLETSSSCPQ